MAAALLLWATLAAGNIGEVDAARGHAERALGLGTLPPFLAASLHAELSQLAMSAGDHHGAAEHAQVAWPLMAQVHSLTDSYSLKVATAIAPLMDGRVDEAEAMLAAFGTPDGDAAEMGAWLTWHAAQAEIARAREQHELAIRRYDDVVDLVTAADPGTGVNPWVLVAASAALVVRAHHGGEDTGQRAAELRDLLLSGGPELAPGRLWFSDLPLNGALMVALAAWVLRYGPDTQQDDGVMLLAVAHRWAYNRSVPVMAWEPMVALADARRPGLVGRLVAELADRPAPDLVPEAAAVVHRLRRVWITSSG